MKTVANGMNMKLAVYEGKSVEVVNNPSMVGNWVGSLTKYSLKWREPSLI